MGRASIACGPGRPRTDGYETRPLVAHSETLSGPCRTVEGGCDHEGSRIPRRQHPHGRRGCPDRQAGTTRSARQDGRRRRLPLRHALLQRHLPRGRAVRTRTRVGGHRGRRGRTGDVRQAWRPRDHLPFGVLRPLRILPDRAHVALPGTGSAAWPRRSTAALEGRPRPDAVRELGILRRTDAGP